VFFFFFVVLFFIGAHGTFFFGASATAAGVFFRFFSAHGAVILGASATAAYSGSTGEGHSRQQASNTHTGQHFFKLFCIHQVPP
jgi:hypothetical protein